MTTFSSHQFHYDRLALFWKVGTRKCYTYQKYTIKRIKMQENDPVCEVEATIGIIGGRWKPMIIYILFDGPYRFGELRRRIPGITQKMLTQQLRDLEADRIVHRQVFAEVPPKVEYSVTPLGETLRPILAAMYEWAGVYRQASEAGEKD